MNQTEPWLRRGWPIPNWYLLIVLTPSAILVGMVTAYALGWR